MQLSDSSNVHEVPGIKHFAGCTLLKEHFQVFIAWQIVLQSQSMDSSINIQTPTYDTKQLWNKTSHFIVYSLTKVHSADICPVWPKALPNPNPVWGNKKMETIQKNLSTNTELKWK